MDAPLVRSLSIYRAIVNSNRFKGILAMIGPFNHCGSSRVTNGTIPDLNKVNNIQVKWDRFQDTDLAWDILN